MSFYQLYRPQNFNELKGQEHITEVLKSALSQKRLAHALLFNGPRGTGKTSTARIVARSLVCEQSFNGKFEEICEECEICKQSVSNSLTDIIEIDAASHGLVDDARNLVEKASFLPQIASVKVYIIDEVHMLSKSAFNALLKIIEEPPSHVYFILATTEVHKVLDTIISRCLRFDFKLSESSLIADQLHFICESEKLHFSEEQRNLIAKKSGGSFRDALSLLEQVRDIKEDDQEAFNKALGVSASLYKEKLYMSLLKNDTKQAFKLIEELFIEGNNLYVFCEEFLSYLSEKMNSNEDNFIEAAKISRVFFKQLSALKDPVHPMLPLKVAVIELCGSKAEKEEKKKTAQESTKKNREDAERQNPIEVKVESKQEEKAKKTVITEEKIEKKEVLKKEKRSKQLEKPINLAELKNFILENSSNPTLKSIIKFAQMEVSQGEINIFVESDFIAKKLNDKKLKTQLSGIIHEKFTDFSSISVHVKSAVKKTPHNAGKENPLTEDILNEVFQ